MRVSMWEDPKTLPFLHCDSLENITSLFGYSTLSGDHVLEKGSLRGHYMSARVLRPLNHYHCLVKRNEHLYLTHWAKLKSLHWALPWPSVLVQSSFELHLIITGNKTFSRRNPVKKAGFHCREVKWIGRRLPN